MIGSGTVADSVTSGPLANRVSGHPSRILLLALLLVCGLANPLCAADFSGANLAGARLTNADLRGSDLNGTNLTDANLSGSDLTNTNVTQRQLDSACGSETRLPFGLTIKPCSAATNYTALSGHRAAADANRLPTARD